MNTMHLFAGGGGGLLADLILGHKPIVAVEWDKYACEILRARRDDGWFEGLHVWEGDVRLFDPSEYKGRVDCIHAGFPCQDLSQAGKQAGLGEGTRSGLYREVLRIAGVVRPKLIFLENVSAILSNGLGTVLADLAKMGYDSRWCCIRASDVGAPHQRDRWWLKAEWRGLPSHTKHNRDGRREQQQEGAEKETAIMVNADSIGHLHSQTKLNTAEGGKHAQCDASASGDDVADTRCELRKEGDTVGLESNEGEWTSGELHNQSSGERFSNPNSAQRKRASKPIRVHQEHTNTSEYSWWEVESDVGRVANGVADWSHRLKVLGNGQVPLQAAVAFILLTDGIK